MQNLVVTFQFLFSDLVVVVVGFIHYNLKHGYFYVDYSIELNVGNGKKHELIH